MTEPKIFDGNETAWCPGCGNFPILKAVKRALSELDKKPHEVLICSGIGQAAKLPQYIKTNGFNGLHGRAIPPAFGAKVANKDLTVIVASGDGDTYGEGGNHFLHNIRRNIDIAHFVHDNQIYGLTKGQASPTTDAGHKTGIQTQGVKNVPLNPIRLAIALGAGFVGRTFTGDMEHMVEMMKAAIEFKGYALLDILQPCISFNKINTFKWYKERVYTLDKTYDYGDFTNAIAKAGEWGDEIPIGIIYKRSNHVPTYLENIPWLIDKEPLVHQGLNLEKIKEFMDEFK